jgi:hypothetical protein
MDEHCKHCGQTHVDRTCCKRVNAADGSRICGLPAVGVVEMPEPFAGVRFVCEQHAQGIEQRSKWFRSRVRRFEESQGD